MNLKIIEGQENSIMTSKDTIRLTVENLSVLEGKNERQIIEYMFDNNMIIKTFKTLNILKETMLSCVFGEESMKVLEEKLIENKIPLLSLIISTTHYYKRGYTNLKKTNKNVIIECTKKNIIHGITLADSLNKSVTIKCYEISLKDYSNILNQYNVETLKNKDIYIDYQPENTPISIYKLYKLSQLINSISSNIEKYNLSNLETIMYVYDIVKSNIYKKDTEDYKNSRDLDRILLEETDTIVCSGFSNLMIAILASLEIKAKPLISYTAKHQRLMIYVKDKKYNINGIYVFDPTWDNKKDQNDQHYLQKYNYFCMPLQRAKLTAHDTVSEILELGLRKTCEILNDMQNIDMNTVVYNRLQEIINFIEEDDTLEEDVNMISLLRRKYLIMMEKYNSRELTIEEFTSMLYSVRRIEYNNGLINSLDIEEIKNTSIDHFVKMARTKPKTDSLTLWLLEQMEIEDNITTYIEQNYQTLIKPSLPQNINLEQDIANIKLLKTLNKVRNKLNSQES